MSKPASNPFLEADFSKLFDASKFFGEFKMPGFGSDFKMPNFGSDFKVPGFNYEALLAAQRKNIEAFTAVNQAAIESFQSIARRQAELFRQGIEESSSLVNAVMSSPTPEEKVIRQAEASKAAVDKCLANARDIGETISKYNYQAMETVSTRLNEGLEELRDIIKTNKAA